MHSKSYPNTKRWRMTKPNDELMGILTGLLRIIYDPDLENEQAKEAYDKIMEWHKHKAQPLVDALERYMGKFGDCGATYSQTKQVLSKYKEVE